MADEVILGRLAAPLEKPLDKPVDIFCQDVPCLTPREVSRYTMVFRLGDAHKRYSVRGMGITCGTYVNGERLQAVSNKEPIVELKHGDVISLGPSHINTYVFVEF